MTAPVRRPTGFGLALFATAAMVIFGNFAQEVAGWGVCLREVGCGAGEEGPKTVAIMIATPISTMVGILSATLLSERAGADLRAATLAMAGALFGAYFALLKAAVGEAGHPQWSRLEVASYIHLVVIVLFGTGPAWLLRMGAGLDPAIALVRRIARPRSSSGAGRAWSSSSRARPSGRCSTGGMRQGGVPPGCSSRPAPRSSRRRPGA